MWVTFFQSTQRRIYTRNVALYIPDLLSSNNPPTHQRLRVVNNRRCSCKWRWSTAFYSFPYTPGYTFLFYLDNGSNTPTGFVIQTSYGLAVQQMLVDDQYTTLSYRLRWDRRIAPNHTRMCGNSFKAKILTRASMRYVTTYFGLSDNEMERQQTWFSELPRFTYIGVFRLHHLLEKKTNKQKKSFQNSCTISNNDCHLGPFLFSRPWTTDIWHWNVLKCTLPTPR